MPAVERARSWPDYRASLAAYARAWQQYQDHPSVHTRALLVTGEQLLIHALAKPGRFPLGQIAATPGSLTAMAQAGHIPPEFLLRHKHGDWGELDPADRRVNEQALRTGQRLLSAYRTRLDAQLWVITEWDRTVTTLLLPAEY